MIGAISTLMVLFSACPAPSLSLSNFAEFPAIRSIDFDRTSPSLAAAGLDCANLPALMPRNTELDPLIHLDDDSISPVDQQLELQPQPRDPKQEDSPQHDDSQRPETPSQISPFTLPLNAFQPMEPLTPVAAPPQHVQWVSLAGASLRYLGIMHTFRVLTEPATRYWFEHNPFFGGYLAALGAMHGWSDGDSYYENYLGHPIQGAVSGYIWIHNDPKYRNVEFGRDPNYWKSRLRAYAYAWAFSEQFEVGLLSEASIGQIQRYCCQFGFVDHVITPNGGMVWMVGEDMLDKYVVRKIEDRTHNVGLRIAARVALNPVQSFANLMNIEYPWYRENRGAPSHYDGSAFASGMQPATSTAETTTYPLIPKFEITATVPSIMQIAGLNCLGGGAVAGFRISDNWQWTAEVGGCTLGNSLPPTWSGDSLTFMSGPEWIRHTESRWSPHAHFRFGGQKITEQHANIPERNLITHLVPKGSSLDNYYNLFNTNYESTGVSVSMGGGVDYRLYAGLALSVANVSWVHSWLDPVHNTDFNNGVRFSTGVVLRIGTW